ncbi:MAG: alginate lyase family protein [Clostridia bacterium]|nr:alginate lyase family protein [Clostridia bacterium]
METTRLSDLRFFTECIDTAVPALSGLPELARDGNFAEATRRFAAYVRETLNPALYLAGEREAVGKRADTVRAVAERVFGHTFISCRVPYTFGKEIDWEFNPTYNGYEEWPWQLNRHPEWKFLAEYFLLTGDRKAAEEWEEQLISWTKQAQVPENASGYATICWCTIEAGIRIAPWTYTFHAFLHAVSDDAVVIFCKSLWEHAWRLRNFNTKNNWLIMELHGLARIGHVFPFFRESAAWLEYALTRLKEELDVQVYPDGMQNELSVGYHSVVVHNYMGILDMYRRTGKTAPDFLEKGLISLNDVYVKLAAPDLHTPAANDSNRVDAAAELRGAMRLYPDNEVYRYIVSGRKEGTPPSYGSLLMPYGGAAVFRTGWEPDAVWAYMDMSPFGAGHQHEDKLNVTVFAYGHEMLHEAGIFDYDKSEMRKYVLSTRAHNTARIDGMDQNCRARYHWEPEDIRKLCDTAYFVSEPHRDTAESTYDEGYGPDFLDVKHTRRFLFCKDEQGLPPFFVVIDRFAAPDDAPHSAELLWHLENVPTMLDRNSVTSRFEDGTAFSVISSAGGISIVKGQKTPEFQGWFPVHGVGDVEHYAVPTIRQTVPFTGNLRVVTVLYPQRPDFPEIKAVEASADPAETGFTLYLPGRKIEITE